MTRGILKSTSRRSVVVGLFLVCGPVRVLAKPCATPKILFVCPAGTVKSAIAREELRRRAKARGISVAVRSRGVHPENHISPALRDNLKADGINVAADPLTGFDPSDAVKADIVVAFDDAAKAPGLSRARAWQVPSWNSQYADAKARTGEEIEALLDELAARRC
jgi:protein-tyrosine-phosphatase